MENQKRLQMIFILIISLFITIAIRNTKKLMQYLMFMPKNQALKKDKKMLKDSKINGSLFETYWTVVGAF